VINSRSLHRLLIAASMVATLAGCASSRVHVTRIAPRVADFRFDAAPPLSEANSFTPWAGVMAGNADEREALDACIADKAACATTGLARYRRLVQLGATLPPIEQLSLVQEFFNAVQWVRPEGANIQTAWESLYQVAARAKTDCKGIALGKYFTLRRLGWAPENLRVVMGWDNKQKDWHALLAVRAGGEVYVLDSILGLQRPPAFASTYMVYSISESGIWDHAPDYVPIQ
jgi:predicted transglutaminase-like cysteine proteinase